MIQLARYSGIALLILLAGCKPSEETYCYPVRIKTTSLSGGTSALIQDYTYNKEDQIESTVRSDYQTYYYTFDERNNISKIARKNVQSLRKHESIYVYDDILPVRIDQYLMRLAPYTQEDEDTSYIAYNLLEYDHNRLIKETVYELSADTEEFKVTHYFEFGYDGLGNISSFLEKDGIEGDTVDAFTYKYSYGKHPLSRLNLGFERESYANNNNPESSLLRESTVNVISEKTDLRSGIIYKYEVRLNASSYAEQVNVREYYTSGGNSLIEIVTVEYDCH